MSHPLLKFIHTRVKILNNSSWYDNGWNNSSLIMWSSRQGLWTDIWIVGGGDGTKSNGIPSDIACLPTMLNVNPLTQTDQRPMNQWHSGGKLINWNYLWIYLEWLCDIGQPFSNLTQGTEPRLGLQMESYKRIKSNNWNTTLMMIKVVTNDNQIHDMT